MINKLYTLARLEFGSRITRTDQTQLKSYRFLRIFLTSPEVATPNPKRAYFRTSENSLQPTKEQNGQILSRSLGLEPNAQEFSRRHSKTTTKTINK